MTLRAYDDTRPPRDVAPTARRWMLIAGAATMFAIAVLAASVTGHPVFERSEPEAVPMPVMPAATLTPSPGATPPQSDDVGGWVVLVVLGLLVVALTVLLLFFLVRALIGAWNERPLRAREAALVETGIDAAEAPADSAPDAPVIRRGVAAALTAARSHPDPTDAIIAAWVGLEETATDSGSGRGRSETPAEFTLRILLRRPGIDEPARALLRLYEGVRFGGRSATEQDRLAAVRSLSLIEEGWR